MHMAPNIGNADRLVRLVLALLIVSVYFSGVLPHITGIILLVIAGILVVTSLVRFCPLYAPFRFNTCRRTQAK